MTDISGSGDASEVDDVRYKLHSFYCKTYPYTVEYEVEIKYNYTMFFPEWSPVEGLNFAVEQSKATFVCSRDYLLRYRPFNYTAEPTIVEDGSKKNYTWEVKNLPAIEGEANAPDWYEITPTILFGPSAFKVGDYEGNMSSWQDFGKFVYTLKKDRDDLPDNVKAKIHQLADGLKDEHEKVRVLYQMMQNSTRYISIQLGIGGWQPFDAKYVAAKGYGDCKALSNYMYSILKEAGIKSFYTLAKAGEGSKFFVSDFPSSQFNHVILCVPMTKDTVWLECTSQKIQAGYLSAFTADRPVLLIDENGGKLVRTPKYGINENVEIRKIQASIDSVGSLTATINTMYGGMQQDDLFELIHSLSKEKLMEYLKREIELPQYDVSKFDYTEKSEGIPSINENLEINALNYAAITGKRIFISPNLITRISGKFKPLEKRIYPIQFEYEYRDIDTAVLKIPSGYKPESVPADLKIESKFGKYTASVKVDGDKISYYRKMEKYSGTFPASDYNDLVKFYDQIYKADRTKIVLVKN
ncbi:MAG: hypothetical protein C5B52_11975 [Bacteroidetes bacterium]|nr:MAG: hypothetical protein C5B52_11975 [Bacteroidota bacterium]